MTLSACSSAPAPQTGMTPMPKNHDPSDEVLIEAISAYVASRGAPPNSTYDFVRVDLNNDGMREGLVLFKLPHSYWCGWDGCGLAIFQARKKSFTPMSAMSGVRGPLHVSRISTNGWRDLIIRVSGTNIRDKDVVMKFDGRSYPNSLMLAPTLRIPASNQAAGTYFR